jgi:sulfur-oxidizing protein SoxY
MGDDRAMNRRSFLLATAGAAASVAFSRAAWATAPDDDEPTDATKKVLHDKFGDRPLAKGHVQFDIPEDAPDGRAVPLFIETDFDETPDRYVKAFHIIVDHNPDIYVAGFHFSPGLGGASIDTRIKMRRESYVRAIAELNTGELYVSAKKVFVSLNGCG